MSKPHVSYKAAQRADPSLPATAAEWLGRWVRSRVTLSTYYYQAPAGTLFEVKYVNPGLDLLSAPCPHCGVRTRFVRVDYQLVDLLPATFAPPLPPPPR